MSSFCAKILLPKNYKPKFLAHKSCAKNIGMTVNFTNILWAAFSYQSSLRSLYVLTIWVSNFLAKGILAQKLLIKCWWNWHQVYCIRLFFSPVVRKIAVKHGVFLPYPYIFRICTGWVVSSRFMCWFSNIFSHFSVKSIKTWHSA